MPLRDVLWQLTIHAESMDGLTVLTLAGRVSHATARRLSTVLSEHLAGRRPVVVDISGVDYISSAGFHALEQAARGAQAAGVSVILCSLQEAVRPAFALAGPIPHVTLAPDREAAINRAMARTPPSA